MTNFERQANRINSCREAAVRCDQNGRIEMSRFWAGIANWLETRLLQMTVEEAEKCS